jgi:hypothetical protein
MVGGTHAVAHLIVVRKPIGYSNHPKNKIPTLNINAFQPVVINRVDSHMPKRV